MIDASVISLTIGSALLSFPIQKPVNPEFLVAMFVDSISKNHFCKVKKLACLV